VTVTGVRNGQVYALGRVPAAGCKATDSLSGIGTQATVKITPTSPKAPGTYKATCTGAVAGAGLPQASPVSVTFRAANVAAALAASYGGRQSATSPPLPEPARQSGRC
jgi:hypothetical protein